MHFTLCATLIWGLRRALGSLVVAALAAVLLAAVMFQEPTLVIGFAACVALAAGLAPAPCARVLAGGLGLLCGLELLGKINAGITLTLLGAVAVAAAPAGRRMLASLLARRSVARRGAGLARDRPVAGRDRRLRPRLARHRLGLLGGDDVRGPARPVGVLGGAGDRRAGLRRRVPRRPRPAPPRAAGLLALWAILAFTCFKSGFVRHDAGHANIFFATPLGRAGRVRLGRRTAARPHG